ncbi:MAG: nuclear transport factor 2 family protein [Gammaproteobacteria bacterium]|nr:nuclear transport factor 2 family protein [Gammaproteobacteria bacterium]
MKRYIVSYLTLVLALSCTPALAGEDAHSEDREQFREYLSTIEAALNEGAIDKISPLLRDDVVVTFVNAEVTRGIPAIRDYYNKLLGASSALLSDYKTKAEVSAPARFFGNIAIADGTSIDTYTFPTGNTMEMPTKWNVTLVRENDVWKVAQLNFSANPFDNPVLGDIKNRLVTFCIAALALGLVIGGVIGRFTGKRA